MKNEPCAMAALVEAKHDGRLGPTESASVERHLATCAACTRLAADLRSLRQHAQRPLAPPPALQARRARNRLLQDAAQVGRPAPKRHRAVGVGLTVAALAALVLGLLFRSPPPLPLVAAPLPTFAATRLVTEVRGEPGAVFSRVSELGIDRVDLTAGKVVVAAKKLAPGERFLLRTTDAEVEVRGTQFAVSASAGRLVQVSVAEGRVSVRYQEQPALFLDAGQTWNAPPRPAEDRSAELAVQTKARARSEASSTPPSHVDATVASTASDFRDAVGTMERGDYGLATEQLQRFSAQHPDDPRAEDAAFLAILSLQRAGRADEARAAARAYLQRFPKGFRRSEAAAVAAGAGPNE